MDKCSKIWITVVLVSLWILSAIVVVFGLFALDFWSIVIAAPINVAIFFYGILSLKDPFHDNNGKSLF